MGGGLPCIISIFVSDEVIIKYTGFQEWVGAIQHHIQSISPEGPLSLVTEALSCQNRTRGQERAANEQKKPWGLIQHTGRDMGRELVPTLSL